MLFDRRRERFKIHSESGIITKEALFDQQGLFSGDGGSRTHVRKTGHSSRYMFSPLLKSRSCLAQRTKRARPSSVRFHLSDQSILSGYPTVSDVHLQTQQEKSAVDEVALIRQPEHTHNCLRLLFFPDC